MDNSKNDNNRIATLLANPPKWDLVGPTAEDDIQRAIARYGSDAVKAAVRSLTKPKRGRKPEKDWPELREFIEADARDWLAGEDPFATRTNYSIARAFAEKNPGHSAVSTHKRIERKLAKKPYDRRWFTLVVAENLSRDSFPHAQHIRALKALAQLSHDAGSKTWESSLKSALLTLADYEAKNGAPPPAELSMDAVESASRHPVISFPEPFRRGGMFGLLSAPPAQREQTE